MRALAEAGAIVFWRHGNGRILADPHPNGPRRQPALGVRRDIRGAVPDLGLSLSAGRGCRRPLRRSGAGLHVLACRQSHGADVRGAPGAARGRRGGGRHRHRHGRGARRADEPAARRRSRGRSAPAVRLLPLHPERDSAPLRGRGDAGRRRRSRGVGGGAGGAGAPRPVRNPGQSDARADRHRRRRRAGARGPVPG